MPAAEAWVDARSRDAVAIAQNAIQRGALQGAAQDAPDHLADHLLTAASEGASRIIVTDLAGTIYVAGLDGSGQRPIRALQGNLTGIAYAEVPEESQT